MKTFAFFSLAIAGFCTAETFQAYGVYYSTFPAAQLFSDGHNLYVGDYSLLGNSEAAPVLFERGDTIDYEWDAGPVATDDTSPTWSGLRLALPATTNVGYDALLLDPSSDLSNHWTDFFVYNPHIMSKTGSASGLADVWYAAKTDISGVWKLQWRQNGTDPVRISLYAQT